MGCGVSNWHTSTVVHKWWGPRYDRIYGPRLCLTGGDATDVAPQSNRCGVAIEFCLAVGPRDDR